jgi:GH43 family beta-xylosidase
MNKVLRQLFIRELILACIIFWSVGCKVFEAQREPVKTFTNPLLPSGADPWSLYKNGYYYYTHTTGRNLVIWKTKSIAELGTAESKVIWNPPVNTSYSKQIWAPEIHFIEGKWYVYFAADDGKNMNHRMYVIENEAEDPFGGTWTFNGKVADPTDKWAIDGSVFKHKRKWYMIWSGWEGDENGKQSIYIAKMKNPWTIEGGRVNISSPTFSWEKHGDLNDPENPPHVDVNEGPQILKHKRKMFLVYSASGCWTDYYGLGMLAFTGRRNLLDSTVWIKSVNNVFRSSESDSVYAPGHNSFFKSPNGKEDWILYHANSAPNQGCGGYRSPRAQKFTWNKDGTPNFGRPLPKSIKLPRPAGEK